MTKINPIGYKPATVTSVTRASDTRQARLNTPQGEANPEPKPTTLHIKIDPDRLGKQD